MNPIRLIKNLFVDFLIWSSGTYVGSEKASSGRGKPDATND
jgi:hypothetical protein